MPSVELRCLTKAYAVEMGEAANSLRNVIFGERTDRPTPRSRTAVDHVSLSIESGERVGIIGPNGAGKSTLLHMIAGIGVPTSGTVTVNGRVTSILTLGIGLRDELTGRENIYLDGELQGKVRTEIDEVIDEIIAFAELGEFIDRPVRTYSTGMKSRLAFAMISHIDPEILLIDEALSVGDAAFSVKATKRIRGICAKGKIVVVVSHGLTAINEICNRCMWMEGGRIVMDGRPEEVTRAYAAAVHEHDDREILQKFHALVGSESFIEGYSVHSVELRRPGGELSNLVLHADQGFTAHIEARLGAATDGVTLRLSIERLDGLLLLDETASLPHGNNLIEVSFPPALAHGVYKLGAELGVSGAAAARRSLVFEVVSGDRPTGGRPALDYPYSVSVERIPVSA